MADPKKISSQASQQELERWLREQLNAAGNGVPAGQPQQLSGDDPFYQDAVEGLNKFRSPREIYKHTSRINRSIQRKTGADKKKASMQTGHLFWFVVAILVIIMVIILAFVVIRMRVGQI